MLIKCPECGKEISDMAANCPNCGCPLPKNNAAKKTFPWKIAVIFAAVFLLIGGALFFWQKSNAEKQAQEQAELDSFAQDAETLIKAASQSVEKEGLSTSWTINGKTLTFRMKLLTIDSDHLAIEFATGVTNPQDSIDSMAESCAKGNAAAYEKLLAWGHTGFVVRFEEVTSDDVLIVAAENGEAVYKITKDNFKFG